MFRIPDVFEVAKFEAAPFRQLPRGGIYALLNLVNGKFYIGSALRFNKRWTNHKSLLNLGNHYNLILQRAWDKHGQINFIFVILEYCEKEKLTEIEQYYLNTLKPEYNILTNAYTTFGYKHTEKSKALFKNHKVSEEAKAAMSKRLKGKKQDPEFVIRRTKSFKGMKRSKEIRDQISKAQTKRYALNIDPSKMIDWNV